ncbi:MAG: hypothetical protein EBS38_02315 [Actinobacteria bacterium]|nr:hypothetical protein [Actinomycetota bacterium]
MANKAAVAVGAIGALASSIAFVLGLITGADNAMVSNPRSEPAPYCFEDPSPDQFTKKHVQTKIVACQVMGMTKAEAIQYIESKGLSYRIASEDGESFALTEDYTDSRINLDILVGLVVGANAW